MELNRAMSDEHYMYKILSQVKLRTFLVGSIPPPWPITIPIAPPITGKESFSADDNIYIL